MIKGAKVYLVGAGPGAVDLLTLRAVKVLEQAEIVLYDALVNPEILSYCPPTCEKVPVGTRGHRPVAQRQDHILARLAEATQTYRVIVRLKGGDPGLFGREGEEVGFLAEQGIAWEVVPGISAGVGGMSAMGLALTHRHLSSSLTLLSGSEIVSGAYRFDHLPLPLSVAQTLVFYMSFRHVAEIARQLMDHGLDPATPAVCAGWVSYPQETLVEAPILEIGTAVATSSIEAPAVLVVGEVVGFWSQLRRDGVHVEPV